jgi:hypothetical protein
MATTKAKTLSGKELGSWKIKRAGENQIVLTIPAGMKLQGDDLTIEDLMGAISNYMIVKKGRVLACCSGNIAIA